MKQTFILFFLLLPASLAQASPVDGRAMVEAHNKWRQQVGVGKLGYSGELAKSAQDWANELKAHNGCQMKHSKPNGKYGENLYWASAMHWSDGRLQVMSISPEKAVDSWGSEKADYSYRNNSCQPGKMCGHYTQMVWKDTQLVGCAMAVCEDSKDQVWVCQYQPAGNWIGRKPY